MKTKIHLIVLVVLLLGIATPSFSLVATTKENFFACVEKQWAEDMMAFISARDEPSFNAYIDTKKCLIMRGGLRVTITESPGMFGSYVGFIFQGNRFWTPRKAIDYSDE